MSRVGICVCALLTLASQAVAQDAPRPDGWVVLPIDEYRALRARAFPPDSGPSGPPIDATLTRVEYDLHLSGDSISGQARLTIDVLKQGWAAVQVPSGMLVRDASVDGRPTALVEDRDQEKGAGAPRVLLSRPGRTVLTLDVVVPLTSAAGAESMTLPATKSGLSSVAFVVPKTGVDLSVSGGFIAEKTESAAESRWVVYGEPGHALTFNWKRKSDDRRTTLPLRTRARIVELVALGEDSTQVTASIQIDVTQGQAREAVVTLPTGLIVNQVAGANVADWNVDRGSLDVTFLEAVSAQASIVVSGELRAQPPAPEGTSGQIAIPIVRMPSVERETGGVAVDVVGPGDIGAREPRGLEPADPSDLGDIVAGHESPSMAAFRFTPLAGGAPRSLTLNVTRYTPKSVLVANVEEARYDALVTEDGKLLVRARYAIRNNQRSFLAVALPQNATLWSASLAGRPVRPGIDTNGALLLPLRKGRANEEAPAFAIELLYLQRAPEWSDKGDARLALPAVDLPVSRTGVTIHYSPRYAIDAKPGAFRLTTDSGPFSAALRAASAAYAVGTPPPSPARPTNDREARDMKVLLDKLQAEAGHTREGAIPIAIVFPSIGPSLFFEAELTAEAQSPSLDFQYRRTGGR